MGYEKEKETMKGNSRVKFRVTSILRISTAAALPAHRATPVRRVPSLSPPGAAKSPQMAIDLGARGRTRFPAAAHSACHRVLHASTSAGHRENTPPDRVWGAGAQAVGAGKTFERKGNAFLWIWGPEIHLDLAAAMSNVHGGIGTVPQ